jgi:hypothetical protein
MSDKAQGYAGSGIQNSSAMHGNQRLEALALHHLGCRLGLSQSG